MYTLSHYKFLKLEREGVTRFYMSFRWTAKKIKLKKYLIYFGTTNNPFFSFDTHFVILKHKFQPLRTVLLSYLPKSIIVVQFWVTMTLKYGKLHKDRF